MAGRVRPGRRFRGGEGFLDDGQIPVRRFRRASGPSQRECQRRPRHNRQTTSEVPLNKSLLLFPEAYRESLPVIDVTVPEGYIGPAGLSTRPLFTSWRPPNQD